MDGIRLTGGTSLCQYAEYLTMFGLEVLPGDSAIKECPLKIVPQVDKCDKKYDDITSTIKFGNHDNGESTSNAIQNLKDINQKLIEAQSSIQWTNILVSAAVSGVFFSVMTGLIVFLVQSGIYRGKGKKLESAQLPDLPSNPANQTLEVSNLDQTKGMDTSRNMLQVFDMKAETGKEKESEEQVEPSDEM